MSDQPAKTIENRVVDSLVAALEEIKTPAYYTNPIQVVRMLGNILEVPERPVIFVTPMASARSHNCPNSLRRVDLGITVTCVLDVFSQEGSLGRDFAETERAIREFTADVEKAATADIKRGGLAIDTTILSVDIYELHEAMPVAAAEVTLSIPFRHLTHDPTKAQ